MKNVLLLFLSFLIFSCHDEKANPTPTQLYPVEVEKTESYNSKATTSKFSYDSSRKLVREDILQNNALVSYKLFIYDPNWKITTISYFSSKNKLQEQNYLTYNSNGQLERFSHSYVDTSGNKNPHHYREFEYDAAGKISRVQDFSPVGSLQKNISLTDESNLQVRVEERGADNSISLKSVSVFDGRFHPLSSTGITFISELRPGNEKSNKLYDAVGAEIVSWSKDITYNTAGYPLRIVQTYSNGVIKTESYTYSALN